MKLAILILLGSLAFGADEKLEDRLREISKGIVAATIQDERNAAVFTDEERRALVGLIKAGLPFSVVICAELEAGRYFDLDGNEAKTIQGKDVRACLLDNEGNPVDFRVVKDKRDDRFVIQADRSTLVTRLEKGKPLPASLVQDITHETIRFAYHVGKIDRNDDERALSGKLKPLLLEAEIVLPSAAYRFDFHRRHREIIPRLRELIWFLENDLKNHRMAPLVLGGYRDDLATTYRSLKTTYIPNDETRAKHLDDVERSLIQQRATFIEIVNCGHWPIERPANLKRDDFKARAAVLLIYCERLDSMIAYHGKLLPRQDAQDYLTTYGRLGVDYFQKFDRGAWRMSDEELAKRFDDYEKFFEAKLRKWQKEFPPIN